MPVSIWKGSLTFGLVNIPVVLHSAENSEEDVSFHMLDRRDQSRIQYRRVNAESGEEVEWEDIVKGYEYDKGKYVLLEKEDLDRAKLESDETAEIVGFVSKGAIDPQYFERPYYLVPNKTGIKGYVLLREALKRSEMIGVVRIILRVRDYVGALVVSGDGLILNTLRFASEVRTPQEVGVPHETTNSLRISDKEVRMAQKLVEEMQTEFTPAEFYNLYAKRIGEIVDEKLKGRPRQPKVKAKTESKRGEVIDLMDLLQKSVQKKAINMRKEAKEPKAKKSTGSKKRKKA